MAPRCCYARNSKLVQKWTQFLVSCALFLARVRACIGHPTVSTLHINTSTEVLFANIAFVGVACESVLMKTTTRLISWLGQSTVNNPVCPQRSAKKTTKSILKHINYDDTFGLFFDSLLLRTFSVETQTNTNTIFKHETTTWYISWNIHPYWKQARDGLGTRRTTFRFVYRCACEAKYCWRASDAHAFAIRDEKFLRRFLQLQPASLYETLHSIKVFSATWRWRVFPSISTASLRNLTQHKFLFGDGEDFQQ